MWILGLFMVPYFLVPLRKFIKSWIPIPWHFIWVNSLRPILKVDFSRDDFCSVNQLGTLPAWNHLKLNSGFEVLHIFKLEWIWATTHVRQVYSYTFSREFIFSPFPAPTSGTISLLFLGEQENDVFFYSSP